MSVCPYPVSAPPPFGHRHGYRQPSVSGTSSELPAHQTLLSCQRQRSVSVPTSLHRELSSHICGTHTRSQVPPSHPMCLTAGEPSSLPPRPLSTSLWLSPVCSCPPRVHLFEIRPPQFYGRSHFLNFKHFATKLFFFFIIMMVWIRLRGK